MERQAHLVSDDRDLLDELARSITPVKRVHTTTCPECASTAATWKQQAWGDALDCPDCGYHRFDSIGD